MFRTAWVEIYNLNGHVICPSTVQVKSCRLRHIDSVINRCCLMILWFSVIGQNLGCFQSRPIISIETKPFRTVDCWQFERDKAGSCLNGIILPKSRYLFRIGIKRNISALLENTRKHNSVKFKRMRRLSNCKFKLCSPVRHWLTDRHGHQYSSLPLFTTLLAAANYCHWWVLFVWLNTDKQDRTAEYLLQVLYLAD